MIKKIISFILVIASIISPVHASNDQGTLIIKKSAEEFYGQYVGQYAIYTDSDCSKLLKVTDINKDGISDSIYLDTGTYYIKEINTGNTLLPNSEVKEVQIKSGEITEVIFETTFVEPPISLLNSAGNTYTTNKIESWTYTCPSDSYGSALYVGDERTFCIMNGVIFNSGVTYKATTTRPWYITEACEKQCGLYDYYGTKYNNRGSNSRYWFATQSLIWKEIYKTTSEPNYKEYPDDGNRFNYKDSSGNTLQAEINAILDSISHHNDLPSFDKQTFEISNDGSLKLEDANGCLDKFTFKSDDFTLEKKDNTLTITPKNQLESGKQLKVTYSYLENDNSQVLYYAPVWQTIAPGHYWDGYQFTARFKPTPVYGEFYIDVTKTGSVSLKKESSNPSFTTSCYSLENAIYGVYKDNKCTNQVGTLKTDAKGISNSLTLEVGNYFVKEISAPYGFVLNPTIYPVTLVENQPQVILAMDKPVGDPIGMVLKKESNENFNGNASLEGAHYLFSFYDAYYDTDPQDKGINPTRSWTLKTNEKGIILMTKDFLVEGDEFYLTESNAATLPLGTLVVKEVKAPTGYRLDKTVYIRKIELDSTLEKIKPFNAIEVKEDVQKQPISILKVDSISNNPIANATFTIKLKSEVEAKGWDKAAIIDTMTTDINGKATSNPLPFGTYVLKETIVPDNYHACDDIEFTISKNTNTPLVIDTIKDEPYQAKIQIIKVDTDTNKTIQLEGITFKVKNTDTNQYLDEPLVTDRTGTAMTPLLPFGHYQVEEMTAPNGYILNTEPVQIEITSVQDKPRDDIFRVYMKNSKAKGQIEIYKEGEVLTGFKDNTFIYETKRLDGIEFDLLDQNKKVIEHLITKDGKAVSSKLDLGTYYIQETKSDNSHILDDSLTAVTLSYKDQYTPVVMKKVTLQNKRQTIDLSLVKKDANTSTPLSNATFALYTKQDIYSYNKQLLVQKDTLLEKANTNKKGLITFSSDLPIGQYYIKELKAPNGYVLPDTTYEFDFNIENSTIQMEIDNKPTQVEISKVDITNQKELEGATLTLLDKDLNVIETWISSNKPHLITKLNVNQTYILKEEIAPYGFNVANQIEFKVENTGKIQKVKMVDELTVGKVFFEKKGPTLTKLTETKTDFGTLYTPVWKNMPLEGAILGIYAKEDITLPNGVTYYQKDQLVCKVESNQYSTDLLVGKYYAKELEAPEGYMLDTNIYDFEINSQNQIHTVSILNKFASYSFNVTKVLEEGFNDHQDAYKDIIFGIYAKQDIGQFVKKDMLVDLALIDENGKFVSETRLPYGKYYLKELQTNDAYQLNETIYSFAIKAPSSKVKHFTINIGDNLIENDLKKTSILVKKVDSESKAILENALITLYDQNHNIISSIYTNQDGIAQFDELDFGTYYIAETQAPNGYQLNSELFEVHLTSLKIVEIEIENTKEPEVPTGDASPIMTYVLTMMISLMLILTLLYKKEIH